MSKTTSGDWLSIRQASQLLGVHIGTVREWANTKSLPSYRTLGGHRRFSQTELQKFLEQQRNSAAQTNTPTEQVLVQVREQLRAHPHGDWLPLESSLNEQERAQQREFGQRLLACVVAFVEEPKQGGLLLDEGRRIARAYGGMLAANGVSAGNAARATIYFRRLILKSILQTQLGSRTGDEEDAQLFQRLSTFLDEILLAIVQVYP